MPLLLFSCARSCLLAVILLTAALPRLAGGSTVFSTGFEQSEGYNMGFTLAGQQGWVATRYDATYVFSQNNNQSGWIGYWGPTNNETFASVWKPINLTTIPSNAIVRFSVDMTIIDSNNGNYDEFRWSAYNASSNRLFSLVFDNDFLAIYYLLSDGNGDIVTATGLRYNFSYNLIVTMDFAHNRWNASLSGIDLQINQPITLNAAPLTFGDMDAVWFYHDPDAPGDNYLLFDNYKVTLDVPPSLQISRATNNVLVRLSGENGQKYVLDRSPSSPLSGWAPISPTNTLSTGFFDTTDSVGASGSRRFYRGRLVP